MDELLPLVYEELRVLAFQKLSHESPGQTVQATTLVHEVYLRLVGEESQNWQNRGQFFAAAAEASRTGAELLFQVLADRYKRAGLPITRNLPFRQWDQVFSRANA